MKKWLIATGNVDKFKRTRDVLASFDLGKIDFLSLSDLEIFDDVVESGTILDRAIQKVEFYNNILIKKGINDIDVVMAIDEGMKLPGKKVSPESKKIADQLLAGEIGKVGDEIEMVMGTAFLDVKQNKMHTSLIHTPYVFLGNENNIKREEGKYILGLVFARLGTREPMLSLNDEEVRDYFLQYWKEDYEIVLGKMGF